MKVHLLSNNGGCEVTSHLLARLEAYLRGNTHDLVSCEREADAVVFLGCGFDALTAAQATATVERLARELSPRQTLVVGGCWAGMANGTRGGRRELVSVPLWDEQKFEELFGDSPTLGDVVVNLVPASLSSPYHGLFTPGQEGDYFLYASRGCTNACSYCFIKAAKGPLCSVTIEELEAQYARGIERGYRRFVILSDDFGSYGADLGVTGVELLKRLVAVSPGGAFVINYLFPGHLIDMWEELEPLVGAGRVEAINIPVQTLSKRLLSMMNRHYPIDEVLAIVRKMKKVAPRLRVVTHCLMGFPTETREDFLTTLFGCAELFDAVAFFVYRDRPGVPAFDLAPKVPEHELAYRQQLLHDIAPFVPTRIHYLDGGGTPVTSAAAPAETPARELVGGASEAGELAAEPTALDDDRVRDLSLAFSQRHFWFAATFFEILLGKLSGDAEGPLGTYRLVAVDASAEHDALAFRFELSNGARRIVLRAFPPSFGEPALAQGRFFHLSHDRSTPLESVAQREGLLRLVAMADRHLSSVFSVAGDGVGGPGGPAS